MPQPYRRPCRLWSGGGGMALRVSVRNTGWLIDIWHKAPGLVGGREKDLPGRGLGSCSQLEDFETRSLAAWSSRKKMRLAGPDWSRLVGARREVDKNNLTVSKLFCFQCCGYNILASRFFYSTYNWEIDVGSHDSDHDGCAGLKGASGCELEGLRMGRVCARRCCPNNLKSKASSSPVEKRIERYGSSLPSSAWGL